MNKLYNKLYMIGLTLLVLSSIAMSTTANSNTETFTKGFEASATWYPMSGGFLFLDVIKEATKTYVTVLECDNSNNCGQAFAVPIPDNAFDFQNNLVSANLSQVTVPLNIYSGKPPSDITVNALWTGVGDISRSHVNQESINGFKFIFNGVLDRRNALSTGVDSIHGILTLNDQYQAKLENFNELQVSISK